jgi:hypothetical protein
MVMDGWTDTYLEGWMCIKNNHSILSKEIRSDLMRTVMKYRFNPFFLWSAFHDGEAVTATPRAENQRS